MVEEGRQRSERDQAAGDEVGDSTEFEFLDQASMVLRRTFRGVFPAPSRMHSSRMFVIEPEHLYHSAEGDVIRLSEAQTDFFDRVANASTAAWWETKEGDSEDEDGI